MGKITLPQNDSIKKALEKKLVEYKGRLAEFNGIPLTIKSEDKQTDSVYKIAIIEELFQKGEVDYRQMQIDLTEKHGFLTYRYNEAFFVIGDYCETSGKNTSGGTGFPLNP